MTNQRPGPGPANPPSSMLTPPGDRTRDAECPGCCGLCPGRRWRRWPSAVPPRNECQKMAVIRGSARIRERPLKAEQLGLPGAPGRRRCHGLSARGKGPGARRPRCRSGNRRARHAARPLATDLRGRCLGPVRPTVHADPIALESAHGRPTVSRSRIPVSNALTLSG